MRASVFKLSCISLALGMAAAQPAAAETRSFVVSMFYPASYNQDGDCSRGVNIPTGEQYELDLAAAGYSREQIDHLKSTVDDTTMFGGANSAWGRAVIYRAKIGGKAVSAWINPAAAHDPDLHMVDGKYSFGFNLDGRGADEPGSFQDPKSNEKGVDNQMFRALGCFTIFRGDEKTVPGAHNQAWTLVQGGMPAWMISVTGDDLSKNGDVTVTFDVAIEHIERDAQSHVLRDMTFRSNRDPRSHHELKGKIENGVLSLAQPGDLLAIWGDEMMMHQFELHAARLRFEMRPDGTMGGMIGGYMPWKDAMSTGLQANMGSDWVGVYYNLRKAADANPDPKTGLNQHISTAYMLEAVPAYLVVPGTGKKVAGR